MNFLSDKNNNFYCPSPIMVNKNNQNFTSMFKNNNGKNISNRINNLMHNNLFSNKSLNIIGLENPSYQPIPTETHFSQLLTLMANGKQNSNINSNINNTNKNNSNNITNINTNNNRNYLSNKLIYETKNSSNSLASNFFNNKQKTNKAEEEGNTVIIKKNSEILLPTLNVIFNDNKVEAIKVKMNISRQKEKRRKIFSFGKKTAKLFRNKNYTIILLDKNNDEYIEIENNNNNDINSNNNNNEFKNDQNNNINLNQNKLLLDNIPEISTDDEYSIHHFDNIDLTKEGIISFTLNALYKNINSHTNMKYSQNAIYQEKTLNYLTKLIENKTNISSSINHKDINQSKSLSYSSTSKDLSFNSIDKSIQNSSFNQKITSNKKFEDLLNLSNNDDNQNDNKSEDLFEIKKRKMKKNKSKNMNNNRLNLDNFKFSRLFTNVSNKGNGLKNKSTNNLVTIKSKGTKKSKKKSKNYNSRFTFKIDSNNEDFSNNESINTNSKKKSKKLGLFEDKKKLKKNSYFNSENVINLKPLQNSRTFKKNENYRRSHVSEHKHLKKRYSKRKSGKVRNKLNLDNLTKDKETGMNNSFDYFAKEERNENDCKII